MNTKPNPSGIEAALRRSDAPYVVFDDDAAHLLRLGLAEARDAIESGRLGPWFLVQGRPAVLRETLRKHLGLVISQRGEIHKELLPDHPGGLRRVGGTPGAPDLREPEQGNELEGGLSDE